MLTRQLVTRWGGWLKPNHHRSTFTSCNNTEHNMKQAVWAPMSRLKPFAMSSSLAVVLVSLLLATPALIFWLWLVVVPARVAILCPEGCECDTGGYHVDCSGTSLNPVPSIHLTGVGILQLFNYNITFLEKDSFVSLTGLEKLTIFKCGLRTIELGAFNGLTKLTGLSLIYNEIRAITPGTFETVNSLEYLGKYNNRIEHVDSAVFSALANLEVLDLSQNKLQYIHPDAFLGLPKVQELNLFGNLYLHIPTDRHFINSHSLSHLVISRCNVSSLSVETFANVSELNVLNLGYNKLRTVDINILRALPKLSEMYLGGNPLQCDCQLQEVWRWCEDRNIETAYEGTAPECDTPREVRGMWWKVLEKGQCLEGNIQYYGDYNSTRYSYTGHRHSDEYDFEFFKQYQVPIYAVPFIFGTISNVILLIIIICNKDMRTLPNMYILNLAISDIFCLTVLFPEAFAIGVSDTRLDGGFSSTFLPLCRRMSVSLSAYSVAVYSFQRYRVIVNPFQVLVSPQPTWRVTVATICGVWILAVLLAIPSALSTYVSKELLLSEPTAYYQLVVIFEHLISCFLPLCLVAFSYVMTARHLVVSSHSISEGTENPQLETRRHTAKVVVGLTVVFLITFVPYHVFWTYRNFAQKEEEPVFRKNIDILDRSIYKFQYTYVISTCFLLINSCLNPVALFCTSSPFRQHLKRYLTCFCKTNSPPTDLEHRRRN